MADYNINAVTRRKVFTGSAGLGPYAFTFEILDDDDLAVYFNATKLTKTTDYSVTINANGTGSVTLVVNVGGNVPQTPIASDAVIVVGARDIERTTDFVTAGDLLASSLNEQLDSLTIFDQQIAEEEKRTLQAPVYDPAHVDEGGTLDMTLPAKAARAGKYLQFNSTTGNPEAGPDSTDVTAIANIATDIATLADIEDGTDATDAIQTVAGIASNVTTVAGVSANVTTVAGQTTNMQNITDNLSDVQNAATNAATASTKATEAATSATAAATSATASASSASASAASESAASTSESNASTSESNAASSASSASTSAATATTQAGIATTKAGEASTSASNAATSESNAATSESNASTSASNAATSATSAATSAAAAEAAFDAFDDIYLGAKSSAPTVDNDGDALTAGDQYFNTTNNTLFVWNGSAWQAASPDLVGDTTPQLGGNLDLNSNDITGTGNINNTGTITTDGLTVDGNAGIGDSNPQRTLSVNGIGKFLSSITLGGTASSTDSNAYFVNEGFANNSDSSTVSLGTVSTRPLIFATNSTERMRIDGSSGNVSIGTSSAQRNLHVHQPTAGSSFIQLTNTATGSSTGDDGFRIGTDANSYTYVWQGENQHLAFATSNTERMRIDSSGNLLVGTTTANPADANDASGAQISQAGTIQASASASTPAIFNRGSDGTAVGFLRSGSLVGSISITTTSTAYNTSSDYRLKENVTYDWDATTRLKQLKPARFNFIVDEDSTVDGFLAHEAQTVVPEAVTGTKDAVDDDGNPVMQGIDQSKLVPLLVKTIQELEARIAALEAN